MVIDNELAIRRLLRIILEQDRYKVILAENGRMGLKKASAERPDVVILEMELPDIRGLTVLRRFREWSQKPVLILSERSEAADKIRAFDDGADDYLTKPFDNGELLARLRLIQRRLPGVADGPLLMEGDLKVNMASHEVTFKGRKLDFTPTEEALFYMLARHAGKTVTCKHLVRCVWGTDAEDKIHDVRVHVANLRRKLGAYGREMLIRTEGSVGYCLSLASRYKQELATVGY